MPKKRIKKTSKLLRYKTYDHINKESFEDFKERLLAMPVNMLLTEHQTLSEYYGILTVKEKTWWNDTTKSLFEKIMFVKDKIRDQVHSLRDYTYMLEYQVDDAYRLLEKEKIKNVEVPKKSTKQSK